MLHRKSSVFFHGEVNVSTIVLVLILTGLSRTQKSNGNAVGIIILKRGLSSKVLERLSSIFQFDHIDNSISLFCNVAYWSLYPLVSEAIFTRVLILTENLLAFHLMPFQAC